MGPGIHDSSVVYVIQLIDTPLSKKYFFVTFRFVMTKRIRDAFLLKGIANVRCEIS